MIDPTYDATITVGGSNSSYKFDAFPQPTQATGGLSGLLSLQSFILQLTMRDSTPAQFDISGATATLYVTAANDENYTPVNLGAGVLSDSGLLGGGTTDRVTFTVPKGLIPDNLGAYGKTRAGNSKFYAVLSDADSYLEFFEGVNVYDTQFGGGGGATPGSLQVNNNNLGVVIDTLNTPPVSPTTLDAYLVGTSPTGDWLTPTDLSDNLVIFNGSAWVPTAPTEGDFLFDADEDAQKRYNGTAWTTEDAKPFSDDSPLINNSADVTKLLTISASGITTATTRTITAADQDIDMTPGTGSYATEAEGNLAATALQNVVEDTTPQLGGTLDSNSKQVRLSKGADVASGAALALGTDGNYFDITGTTTITSIATLAVGTEVTLHFDGILTLTHNAIDLILPGAANITTAAGDEFTFIEYAAGDWRCTSYALASGSAIIGGGGGNFPTSTDSGDKTTAYSIVAGDENTTIVAGTATSADFTITYDVSVWTTAGSLVTVRNESSYIVKIVVSNTITMQIDQGIDKFIGPGETITMAADTATQVWTVART